MTCSRIAGIQGTGYSTPELTSGAMRRSSGAGSFTKGNVKISNGGLGLWCFLLLGALLQQPHLGRAQRLRGNLPAFGQ